ncbi:protein kinase [Cryptosporangium sp. NPDC048952]|uniref:serine/threonine-protein kinase n=1 Tax=Cryptosporangium sp. NPDC048952 TaxID=3363961 RepID=UPI003721E32B
MLFDRAQLTAALPQYEVGAELGRGGFGLVIEGRHRRLGRPVAIKILTISGPDVERRFLAEAQVMAVFDHPHVVRVHDYAESDGLCLIVMEHLPGGTLTQRIAEGLRPETACAIGLAIADALHAAHQRGIVHRDIKPDNVLFAGDGAVKVTDFGIAKLFEGSSITTGTLVGTPAYAAPEQIVGSRVGPATDVYAVGGLVYHMLTGRTPFSLDLPFSAMLHHHLNMRPELPAGMPPQIAAVVGQALEKEPSARPESAKAFALALATAAVADFGSSWSAHADTPLRVDDDVRAVMVMTTRGAQAQLATRVRSVPRRSQGDAASLQLRTPPPGHLAVPEAYEGNTPNPLSSFGHGVPPGGLTTPGFGGPGDSSFSADGLLGTPSPGAPVAPPVTPPPGRSGRHSAEPGSGSVSGSTPVAGSISGAPSISGFSAPPVSVPPVGGPPVGGPPVGAPPVGGPPGGGAPVRAPLVGGSRGGNPPVGGPPGRGAAGAHSVSGSHPVVGAQPPGVRSPSGAYPVYDEPSAPLYPSYDDRASAGLDLRPVAGATPGSPPATGMPAASAFGGTPPESAPPFGGAAPGSPFGGAAPGSPSSFGGAPAGSASSFGGAPAGSASSFGGEAPSSGSPFGGAHGSGSSFGDDAPGSGSSYGAASGARSPYGAEPGAGSSQGSGAGRDSGAQSDGPRRGRAERRKALRSQPRVSRSQAHPDDVTEDEGVPRRVLIILAVVVLVVAAISIGLGAALGSLTK